MRRSFVLSGVAGVLLAAVPGPATAAPPNRFDVAPPAVLTADGAALIRLKVRCDPALEVLETIVTVSQDVAFGESRPPVTCDLRQRRLTVRVESLDAPFFPGPAQLSTLLLLIDPVTGDDMSVQDGQRLRLRPGD